MDRAEIVRRLEEDFTEADRHYTAPPSELARSYAPGKWTVRELLAHVADCEFINLWRFCRAAAEPGSPVESFEENDWARRLDYGARPAEVSRALFLGARRALIHHVKTLPPAQLDSCCQHHEKGAMPAWRWARLAVNHAEHHLSQVVAAREGRPWVKRTTADSWEFGGAPKPVETP